MNAMAPITGVAAGVPFLAIPPAVAARDSAPVVVAWHLMDAPRTESAFAAAVPLDGLDAWRIYLGLPLCGSRLPEGGFEEIMRLGYEDAVLNLQGPVVTQAAEEFPAAFAELRERLGFRDGPIGVVGGSIGAAVAALVITEGGQDVRAAVLLSPLVRLASAVEAMAAQFGIMYPWSDWSRAVAQRLDFVARADEFTQAGQPATLVVVGEKDDESGFVEPARALRDQLTARYADPDRAELVVVQGMAHALAEEPGMDPAPQTTHAAEADRHAVRWLSRHLS